MNIFIRTVYTFALLSLVTLTSPVFAAEIRLDAHKVEITPGEQFSVDVIVHSSESLNAIEGNLVFPEDKLKVKEIYDGNSVVNFWVEKPRVETSNTIVFSGITPGGFTGANNTIFRVIFEAKNTGVASIMFYGVKILQNDGLGTQAMLVTRDTAVSIKPGDDSVYKETLVDTEAPEDFNITIESDPNIFEGKHFIVFDTQDKSSGIARYEVREGRWGWFTLAESPYLLKHQSLDKKIFVKAIDKSNNERVSVLPPKTQAPWWKIYGKFGIIIFVIVSCLFLKNVWPKFTH
jgi:hypothetical protein